MYVTVAGMVSAFKLKMTKNNTAMAYVTLEDVTGSIEMLVFQKALDEAAGALQEDNAVMVYGRISAREDEAPKLMCEECSLLTEDRAAVWTQGDHGPGGRRRGGWGRRQTPAEEPLPTPVPEPQPVNQAGPKLYLRLTHDTADRLEDAKDTLRRHPGPVPVVIFDSTTGKRYMARQDLWVSADSALLEQLGHVLQPQDVVLR